MWRYKIFVKYNKLVAVIGYWIGKFQYAMGYKEDALQTISQTAAYCVSNYIGTYSWAPLERFVLKVAAKELPAEAAGEKKPAARKKVLHVITTAYKIGGHTRFLAHWITIDKDHDSAIVLLHQNVPVPEPLLNLKKNNSTLELVVLDHKAPILERAKTLRALSFSYDYIITHVHSQELLPTLAFSVKALAPVAYMNHADHSFWVGKAVTDILVQYRQTYAAYDAARRGIREYTVLPVPIDTSKGLQPEEARQKLGIAPTSMVLLTVSSEYKFRPTVRHNYFTAVTKILDAYQNCCLYIIGIKPDAAIATTYAHERIRFCGIIEDTSVYETACDVYVDSFPFSSPTSAMQAMAKRKPALLMYAPATANVVFPRELALGYSKDRLEWMDKLTRLVKEKAYRDEIGQQQYEYIKVNHDTSFGWPQQLSSLYQRMDALEHHVMLPQSSKKVYTREDSFVYMITSNNMRLGAIVMTKNPVIRIVTKILSGVLALIRKITNMVFLNRYVNRSMYVDADPEKW